LKNFLNFKGYKINELYPRRTRRATAVNWLIYWAIESNSFSIKEDKLPAELLRKGRFDEIFFLDLPNSEERLNILDLHLKKRRPDYNFPLSTIIDRTDGFSGAELEQAVIEGMHISFSENRELMEKDLIKAVSELVPLSRTAKEQIDLLKEWSSTGRARSAS